MKPEYVIDLLPKSELQNLLQYLFYKLLRGTGQDSPHDDFHVFSALKLLCYKQFLFSYILSFYLLKWHIHSDVNDIFLFF